MNARGPMVRASGKFAALHQRPKGPSLTAIIIFDWLGLDGMYPHFFGREAVLILGIVAHTHTQRERERAVLRVLSLFWFVVIVRMSENPSGMTNSDSSSSAAKLNP
jgi:hypothetical protein